MNKLNHLAIIMDGNGRWAKKRGFLRTNGHEAGANVVSDMCEFCIDNGVKILSLYAFSTENWKRPQKEVDFLMNLLKKFLLLKRNDFIKNGIKFNTIGDISPFSDELKNEIEITKSATRENTNLLLNLASIKFARQIKAKIKNLSRHSLVHRGIFFKGSLKIDNFAVSFEMDDAVSEGVDELPVVAHADDVAAEFIQRLA